MPPDRSGKALTDSIGWIVYGNCDHSSVAFVGTAAAFPAAGVRQTFCEVRTHLRLASREIVMATGLENEQKELAQYIRQGRAVDRSASGLRLSAKGWIVCARRRTRGLPPPGITRKLIPGSSRTLFRCLDEVTKRCPQSAASGFRSPR